ncbi:PREDICTED: probable protein phosphatase 2C 51 [Ipomoea nil]|uniref:probable protein phosphatase 2C 51 n=1 Tax=Ipomoea nil TaxID=35883 RepID=UPI000900C522|nr:PREDICTED: probable protein phosphatase 2C 51 [Ipomoea nil]
MIDNLKQISPAPVNFAGELNQLLMTQLDLSGNCRNYPSRNGLELRRGRPTSDNVADINGRVSKRKRKEMGAGEEDEDEEEELVVSLLFTMPEKGVTCRSHGLVSLIGRRKEMEDAAAAELGVVIRGGKEYDFFGVYDGHGGSGVARACRDRLHRLLMEQLVEEEEKEEIKWEKVMKETFSKMDEEVNWKGAAVATMGSTAVVAMVGAEEVVVANCGDSRAVLSRGGVAVPLSNDHKPDRADELDRIESSGGKVLNWNGHRVLGVLATSRSIGDQYLKPYVIAEPEVMVSKRVDTDEFLILGSDGLWDVISNEAACQVVRRCLSGRTRELFSAAEAANIVSENNDVIAKQSRAAEAAAVLAELAIARGSRDNVSVVIVELRKSSNR